MILFISQVVAAINLRLRNITFPTNEMVILKRGFYGIGKLPNVLGALDGTLIPIKAPAEDEPVFVCRKGYHAINVQAVVDSTLRYNNVLQIKQFFSIF